MEPGVERLYNYGMTENQATQEYYEQKTALDKFIREHNDMPRGKAEEAFFDQKSVVERDQFLKNKYTRRDRQNSPLSLLSRSKITAGRRRRRKRSRRRRR